MGNELLRSKERILAIDALRGFAVMGIILLHNIEHFNYYSFPKTDSPLLASLDKHLWDMLFFLFSGKAYAIFALLFGFTFYLQSRNCEKRGEDFRNRYMWRLVLLVYVAARPLVGIRVYQRFFLPRRNLGALRPLGIRIGSGAASVGQDGLLDCLLLDAPTIGMVQSNLCANQSRSQPATDDLLFRRCLPATRRKLMVGNGKGEFRDRPACQPQLGMVLRACVPNRLALYAGHADRAERLVPHDRRDTRPGNGLLATGRHLRSAQCGHPLLSERLYLFANQKPVPEGFDGNHLELLVQLGFHARNGQRVPHSLLGQ